MRIVWALSVCAALIAVAGCEPTASAPAPSSSSPSGRVTVPSNMYGENPPKPGQCLDTGNAVVVDCGDPHDAEVINAGKLTATTMPDENTAATITMPICRSKLTDYLGGPDADATNLVAMPLWPNEQQWAKGERWLLCTVAEVGSDEKPVQRTGSLEGALVKSDNLRFQTCSVSSPSRDAKIRRGPCDEPHLGEALPGVISLGRAGDPLPATDVINRIAQEQCPGVLAKYIGAATQEVLPAWRLPNAESWARGYTNLVCYAEPIRPVRVRLRNLGVASLPS
jgi:Septum formation